MKRLNGIVESEFVPSTNDLWLNKGTLKYFGPNGWTDVKVNIKELNIPTATTKVVGGVKQATNVSNLAASAELAATVTKVNAILSALKTAGIMVKD